MIYSNGMQVIVHGCVHLAPQLKGDDLMNMLLLISNHLYTHATSYFLRLWCSRWFNNLLTIHVEASLLMFKFPSFHEKIFMGCKIKQWHPL